jgi:hypothetical protein
MGLWGLTSPPWPWLPPRQLRLCLRLRLRLRLRLYTPPVLAMCMCILHTNQAGVA